MTIRRKTLLAFAITTAFCSSIIALWNQGWLPDSLFAAPLIQIHKNSDTSSFPAPAQYTLPSSADQGLAQIPNIHDPEAVSAQTVCPGYAASSVKKTDTGLKARLTLAGPACDVYGTDVEELDLVVEYQTSSRLHVNIEPAYLSPRNESWFRLSREYVSIPSQEDGSVEFADLTFSWSNEPSFSFSVIRSSTGDVLFSTLGTKLVFENQFIEFVTNMENEYNLYGIGETSHGLRLGNNLTRTIWAADAGNAVDGNIYSSHPFYLQTKYFSVDTNGASALVTGGAETDSVKRNLTSMTHGMFLRDAHGMEILLNPTNVTWRTLGGSIDLYFFSGPSQPDVTRQYLNAVGHPVLQQYWAFGFHQCRYGYENWSQTEKVVNTYADFGIPLEAMWNDIDYMNQYRDFDNDPKRFGYEEGRAFLQRLHDRGQHYIPIIDAAIYVPNPENASDAYQVFTDGNDTGDGSFLLNPDGSLYIGAVWPGYTAFPDWSSLSASEWWTNQIRSYHEKIPISGAWIDMSEAASFCVGSCGTGNLSLNPVHPPFLLAGEEGNDYAYEYPEGFELTNATEAMSVSAASLSRAAAMSTSVTTTTTSTSTSHYRSKPTPGVRNVNHPPYVINNIHGDLARHGVSPNATHHDGVLEYDIHNLYGHQFLQHTYAALTATMPGQRPFIIGRSTFAGSGNYSGHWGGDNESKFSSMYFSIPQALSFSLFGIPMFGADVCGFSGNSDEELCNRWMQLGAFFPFYRNHNVILAIGQEAYVWASVAEATRKAMDVRFQLLPYLYTLFHRAHTRGDTVMRALAWEFPNDPSLAAADRQFFLGPSILVTPVLTQGATTVDGVFPGLVERTDVYYDWYNHSAVTLPFTTTSTSTSTSIPKTITIDAPLGHIPVFVRGGSILATQQMAMTTRDARRTDWSIIVAPGTNGSARGTLYLDDGVSITPSETKEVTFSFDVTNSPGGTALSLRVLVDGDFTDLDLPLANITILGYARAAASGAVDGSTTTTREWKINDEPIGRGVYDSVVDELKFVGLQKVKVLDGRVWSRGWELQSV